MTVDAARTGGSPARTPRLVLVYGGFFLLALLAEMQLLRPPVEPLRYNDTIAYMRSAALPVLSQGFLLGRRPPTLPLLYKAVRSHPRTIAGVQSAASLLGWLALGLSIAWHLQRPVTKVSAVAATLLLSFAIPIDVWDRILLAESLSLSLLAASAAATLVLTRFLAEGRPRALLVVVGWAVLCLLFAGIRDSNIYSLATLWLGFSAWLGCLALRRRRGSVDRPLVLAVTLLGMIVAGSHIAARSSGRWTTPLMNVLLDRVLSDSELYDEFVDRYEMPRNQVFERYVRKKSFTESRIGRPIGQRISSDEPELADIGAWIQQRGLSSYSRWLVLDAPRGSIEQANQAFASFLSNRLVRYERRLVQKPWARRLTAIVYSDLPFPLALLALLIGGGMLLAWLARPYRWLSLVALFHLSNAWLQAFITFHGDTSNVARHIVLSGVMFRVGLLMTILVVVDLSLVRFAHTPPSPGVQSTAQHIRRKKADG